MELGSDVTGDDLEGRKRTQSPGHCCTLIYTSGTTGPPKAVMISHDNITFTGRATCEIIGVSKGDKWVIQLLSLSLFSLLSSLSSLSLSLSRWNTPDARHWTSRYPQQIITLSWFLMCRIRTSLTAMLCPTLTLHFCLALLPGWSRTCPCLISPRKCWTCTVLSCSDTGFTLRVPMVSSVQRHFSTIVMICMPQFEDSCHNSMH